MGRRMSEMFTLFVEHLYLNFGHLISGDSLALWLPENTDVFRNAIFDRFEQSAVAVVTWDRSEVADMRIYQDHFDRFSFCVIGYMDDLGIQTCRPQNGRQRHFYR